MSARPELAAVVTGLALVVGAVACGSSSAGPTGPDAGPPPRVGGVTVDPPAGPIGTLFTLGGRGLREGDAVTFEITFPGEGKAFPGAAISVAADGMASTTYRATTANQPGLYLVRLTGPPGTLAEGRFTVTDGPPVTSTFPETATSSGPSTSARTGTTSRSGRATTTVKGGSTTTSTTLKGSTRKAVTTSSTTTTKPGPVPPRP